MAEKDGNVSVQTQETRENDQFIERTSRIRRIFDSFTLFAFSLTFMSGWEGMCTNMFYSLYNGGPQNLAWSIIIAYVGALAQSASLAEMASILPLAGAQYHWTHAMAPAKGKRFITWLQGWVTWFSWISLLAGVTNVNAGLLQSLVGLKNPSYVPQGYQTTLIVYALLLSQVAVNIFAYRWVPKIEVLAGILHVTMFVVFIIVLCRMGGPKNSAGFVFTYQSFSSGWDSSFVGWNIGMLTSTWSFVGFDGALHMSEEVKRARHAVPRALFWSIALNGILAYGMVLAILFAMPPLEETLSASWPIVAVMYHVTGSVNVTIVLLSLLFTISYCVGLASVATLSRLTWAWARDGGLHRSIAVLSPTWKVPIRAILLSSFIVMLLALLLIGASAAFGAIIALSSLGLYFSYWVAIATMLYRRLPGKGPVQLGGWNLGRYGAFINAFALVYTTYVMIWLPFPTTMPVTAVNMNYASPLFVFCVVFAVASWFIHARKHWPGPSEKVIRFVLESER